MAFIVLKIYIKKGTICLLATEFLTLKEVIIEKNAGVIRMYKNFKIDDIDILNIYELQENFSLEKIYFNLEPFKKFAEVHCKSLKKTYYDANGKLNLSERYTYVFWYDVLCGEEDKAEYDGYTEYLFSDAEEFKEKVKKHLRHEDVEKEIIEECECFGLKEKLKYICEKVPEEIKTPKNILLLLAICELSQVNVLKINDFIRLTNH